MTVQPLHSMILAAMIDSVSLILQGTFKWTISTPTIVRDSQPKENKDTEMAPPAFNYQYSSHCHYKQRVVFIAKSQVYVCRTFELRTGISRIRFVQWSGCLDWVL